MGGSGRLGQKLSRGWQDGRRQHRGDSGPSGGGHHDGRGFLRQGQDQVDVLGLRGVPAELRFASAPSPSRLSWPFSLRKLKAPSHGLFSSVSALAVYSESDRRRRVDSRRFCIGNQKAQNATLPCGQYRLSVLTLFVEQSRR